MQHEFNIKGFVLGWGELPAWLQHCRKGRLELALASTLPFPPPQRCLTLGRAFTGAFSQGECRNQGLRYNLLFSCRKRQEEV